MSEVTPPITSRSPALLNDDQRKHLEFIQAVIARLASSSAASKGWSLTLALATFGFSAAKTVPYIAWLGIVVVFVFGTLDSYYLREERLFRALYDAARQGKVEVYSMDKNLYLAECKPRTVVISWSVLGFYLPLLLSGLGAFLWSVQVRT